MKFSINAGVLRKAADPCIAAAPSRSTMTILQSVRLEVFGQVLMIQGTDTNTNVSVWIEDDSLTCHEDGVVVIPADRLAHVLGAFKKDMTINFSPSKSGVNIKGKGGRFHIVTESPEFYPKVAQLGLAEDPMIQVDCEDLSGMITRTFFASCKESTKYAIAGIMMDLLPGTFRLVALDMKRVAMVDRERDLVTERVNGVIPNKAAAALKKLIAGMDDGNVAINIDESFIYFRIDNFEIGTKLVEGTFPAYEGGIPTEGNFAGEGIIIERRPFIDALRGVSAALTPVTACIFITVYKDRMTLVSESVEGDAFIEFTDLINTYDMGEDEHFMFAVNVNYLIEPLLVMQSEKVSLMVDDDGNMPIVMREKGELLTALAKMDLTLEKEAIQERKAQRAKEEEDAVTA